MRTEHRKILNNNSGFTLLELLIVLAIVAIVTGIAGLSYSIVSNADVNKASRNFASVLSKARAESMAKGPDAGQLNLIVENGRLYYWIGTDDAATAVKSEISSSMIAVEVVYDNSTDAVTAGTPITDGFTTTIRFSTSGLVERPGTPVLSKLIFSRGNRRVATTLYFTGKNATALL